MELLDETTGVTLEVVLEDAVEAMIEEIPVAPEMTN